MFELDRKPLVGYGLAIVTTVTALVVTSSVDLIRLRMPFALFFAAVAISTAYAGRHPGLAALVISTVLCAYFFLPPFYSSFLGLADAFQLGIFVTVSASLIVLVSRVRDRELSIEASEKRYRTLFEYAPDGIIVANPDSYYLDANASMCTMLGYSHHELIGMHASDIVTPEERENIKPTLDALNGETDHSRIWQFRRKNGSEFAGQVLVTEMPDGNLMAMIRDISVQEQQQREKEKMSNQIDSERSKLKNIVASVPGVVWEAMGEPCAPNQKIDFISDYVETLLGYTPDECTSTPNFWLSTVHPADRDSVASASRAAFNGKHLDTARQFRWRTKSGEYIWVESNSVAVLDEQGNPVGTRGVAMDITARRRVEEERRILAQIMEGVISTLNLQEFFHLVHGAIGQLVYAENCFVMLRDAVTDRVEFVFWLDKHDPQPASKTSNAGFSDYVLRSGRPLLITESSRKAIMDAGEADQVGTFSPSWVGVPLRTQDGTIGVLVLQHYESENAYSASDVEFLTSIGDQVALAIDRKRGEEALAASEEQYRDLVENAVDIIYTQDLDGNYTSINNAAERITGYTNEEAGTINMRQVVAPQYLERAEGMIAAKLAGQERSAYELEIVSKDGRTVHLDVNTRVIYANGIATGIQGIARDISERKAGEAARVASERKYQALFTLAPVGIYQSQPDGRVTTANATLAKILAYDSADELLGKNFSDIYFDSNERAELLNKYEGQGFVTDMDLRWKQKDGSPIWIQLTAHSIKNSDGETEYFEGFVRDITESKRIREAIEISERELRELAKQLESERKLLVDAQTLAKLGSWHTDLKTREVICSPETYRIFECVPETFRSDHGSFLQLVHPDDRAAVISAYTDSLDKDSECQITHRVLLDDGRIKFVEERWRIVHDAEGKPLRAIGTIMDITDRKNAEIALVESNQKFHQLADHITDAFWIRSHDMAEVLYVSPAFATIWGRPVESLYKYPHEWSNFIFPADRERVHAAFEQLTSNSVGLDIEYRIVRPDGNVRWIRVRGFEVKDRENAVIRYAGIATDITERKLAEDALRESETRFRTIIATEPECVKLLARNGSVLEMNPAGLRMIEADSLADLTNQSVFGLIAEHNRDAFRALTHRVFEGESGSLEFELIGLKGTRRWMDTHASPLRDSAGEITALLAITRDVTERKQATDELQRQQTELRVLFDLMPAMIWFKDTENNILRVNARGAEAAGLPISRIEGQPVADIYPDQAEKFYADDQAVIESGRPKLGYVEMVSSPDGTDMWVETDKVPYFDNNGEAIGIVVMAQDVTERMKAEMTLSELTSRTERRERMLTTMLSSMSDFAQIYDQNGRIHFANQPLLDLWGKSLDEVIGADFHDLGYPEELAQKLKAQLARVFHTNETVVDETSYTRRDGLVGYYEYIFSPAFGPEGNVDFVVGSTRDVTDRRQADIALSESEVRYRHLFQANPHPMWVYDMDTLAFLAVNDAAIKGYGYSESEFRSMTLTHIRPEEDVPALIESVNAAKSGLPRQTVWRHIKKDGSIIDVEISGHQMEFESRRAEVVMVEDITERKRAEAALEAAEAKYRGIFENAVEGIFQSSPAGAFISINPAMAHMLGFESPAEMIADRTDIATQHYVDPNSRRELERALKEEEVVVAFEAQVFCKDGSKKWTTESMRSVRDENGKLLFYEGSISDITIRKQLEDQLRQSQKMEAIGVLAGGIAHDFNNLLTAINGYSDLTLRKMPTDDPLRSNITEVRKAGDRAAELTGQLLAFSRKQMLKSAVINLNTVVSNIENMLRRIIRESIELRTVLDPNLGNVKADPGQIEQVVMNLAINARDAMPDGGALTIQSRNIYVDPDFASRHPSIAAGNYIELTVADTGHGMDHETQAHIFDPFFTTKQVGKGTGLGLSTVYGIVKQSGGDIMVHSEYGHGTTFKIYLPCIDETVKKPRSSIDDAPEYRGTETVLLAEDEEIVRTLVREILVGNGYRVLEADSGAAALSICRTYNDRIDLLLSDVIMPKMGGRELSEKVLKLIPNAKVLFMSGYTDNSIADLDVLDSDTAFIEKPFTPDALCRKVREVLEYQSLALS